MRQIVILVTAFGFFTWGEARANAEDVPQDSTAQTASAVKIKKRKAPKKTGKSSSEKEAEGTEAPNRFEADTVIKSKFQLDGQPLEVDPD